MNSHCGVTYLTIILLNYFHFGDYLNSPLKSSKYISIHDDKFDIKAEETSIFSLYLVALVMAQTGTKLKSAGCSFRFYTTKQMPQMLFCGDETVLSLGGALAESEAAQCVKAAFPPSPSVTVSGAPPAHDGRAGHNSEHCSQGKELWTEHSDPNILKVS